ncbi:hypothetical protein [Deinococcus yavapaiensis]|uniref:SPW repeat-containing protein n=1 Tax=Deinococcus yavapaiensis KR-236 TaxID=694435 RepID=A0A318S1P1_9DEIO|nr:hypothetical protein [Deinococcus yavapaiensis]PYE51836.1 hypothetical protein DES52_11437 [Deinococcus yavapaiensis KR-236]
MNDLSRPLLSIFGLAAGFALYQGALRLPAPWESVAIGVLFAAFGVAIWLNGREDRVNQIVGGLFVVFGVVRFFL